LWTLLALINANGHIRIGEMKRFGKAALTGGTRAANSEPCLTGRSERRRPMRRSLA
jgi:hypothetical protein